MGSCINPCSETWVVDGESRALEDVCEALSERVRENVVCMMTVGEAPRRHFEVMPEVRPSQGADLQPRLDRGIGDSHPPHDGRRAAHHRLQSETAGEERRIGRVGNRYRADDEGSSGGCLRVACSCVQGVRKGSIGRSLGSRRGQGGVVRIVLDCVDVIAIVVIKMAVNVRPTVDRNVLVGCTVDVVWIRWWVTEQPQRIDEQQRIGADIEVQIHPVDVAGGVAFEPAAQGRRVPAIAEEIEIDFRREDGRGVAVGVVDVVGADVAGRERGGVRRAREVQVG